MEKLCSVGVGHLKEGKVVAIVQVGHLTDGKVVFNNYGIQTWHAGRLRHGIMLVSMTLILMQGHSGENPRNRTLHLLKSNPPPSEIDDNKFA